MKVSQRVGFGGCVLFQSQVPGRRWLVLDGRVPHEIWSKLWRNGPQFLGLRSNHTARRDGVQYGKDDG